MIIEPKIRGFICTTAHPEGCRANVKQQIDYVKAQPKMSGIKSALIIGASAGYGLASRITAAFGGGASTLGIIFDKSASGSRTASAGWYNTAAFEEFANADGLYAKTINGDAFSQEIKQQAIEAIKADMGKVDLIIYSLAAPRRTLADGSTVTSVLKTTGEAYTNKTIDLKTRSVSEVTIPPATEQEIENTVSVMGGEDWMDWMVALNEAGVLADNTITVAYSYLGPELTHPVYLNGSIGAAKADLAKTAKAITEKFDNVTGYISVNKALVTQASSAIPIVPLYISILYKVMKAHGSHEGCIEQMYRLFAEKLFSSPTELDSEGMLRLDDWEMKPEIQEEVSKIWEQLNTENLSTLSDIDGYWEDFYRIFGFNVPGVDYSKECNEEVDIKSLL